MAGPSRSRDPNAIPVDFVSVIGTWRTSSAMPYESGSAASEVSLAWFGLRIIPGYAAVRRARQDS
jgi:hypothetical protein